LKNTYITLLALLSLFVSKAVFAETGNLVVEVPNLQNRQGKIVAYLYTGDDPLFEEPEKVRFVSIHPAQTIIRFENILFGDYALILFHDKNLNGRPDHNWLGFPIEPMGFSNSFKTAIFSGKPSFKKLAFPFFEHEQAIQVTIE